MKKSIIFGSILVAALSLASCENSKNGGNLTINAKVVNGALYNDFVDEVRAVGTVRTTWYNITIATGTYKNGGFKLKLTDEIDERLYNNYFDFSVLPSGLTVTNTAIKSVWVDYFEAYRKNVYAGSLYHNDGLYTSPHIKSNRIPPGITTTSVSYLYVDADVKCTGSYIDEKYGVPLSTKVDMDLKKGWNTVYLIKEEASETLTTKKPDVELKWWYRGGMAI